MTILFKAVLYLEFLFQGYCQFIYVSALLKRKQTPQVAIILFFIASTLEFVVYETMQNFVYNVIVYSLFSIIICCICYSARIGTIVLHCFILESMLMLTEVAVLPFANYLIQDNYLQTHQESSEILMSTVSKLLMFFICTLVKHIAEKEIIQTKSIYLFIVPLLSIVVLHTIVMLYSSDMEKNNYDLVFLVTIVSFIVINTVIFMVHENYVKTSKETERLKLLEQKKAIDYEYYTILEKNYEDSRASIHDLKHHIEVLKQLSQTGDVKKIQEYLDAWSKSQFFNSNKPLTKNRIMDVVVYQKSEICISKNIDFQVEGNNTGFEFVEEPDICCIISNLLDNAIEAAENTEEKMIRMIFHNDGQHRNYFISIENSCDKKPVVSNGHLITSKKGKIKHGIGMYSVKRTISKYNGDMDYEYDKDKKQFHITVMLHKR